MSRALADKLHEGFVARIQEVIRSESGGRWLLIGESAGRTVEARYEGDVVRLFAGRIVHAASAEDEGEVAHVIEVVEALHAGSANELFGYSTDGLLEFVGHEIRALDDSFFYERRDESATVVVRCPI